MLNNQILNAFQQLNQLWNQNSPQQTARPQQKSYTDYAEQFAMPQMATNPYGDYSALRSRMIANQPQAMVPADLGAHSEHSHEGGGTDLKGYKITSPFGGRKDPITGKHAQHNGIDLGVPANTRLSSPVDGVVISADKSSSWGNTVVIRDSQGNLHRYAHMNGMSVKPGQKVSKGMYVGVSGNTGRSTGAHLHYEVTNSKGSAINPSLFL